MYYIIKTNTLFGAGGMSASVTIYKKSKEKESLSEILLDEFNEALEDNEVEFINDIERENIDECDMYDGELSIQYFSDGFDTTAIRYDIVSDEEVEEI